MAATDFDIPESRLAVARVRKGDLRRQEMVEAAIECFASIGYEKTTYGAIAKRLNTGKAHVAYYFPDKDEILKASVQHIMVVYQHTVRARLAKAKPGLGMVMGYVEAPFAWARSHPSQMAVMLLFYYLCAIRADFRQLHDELRAAGVQRIQHILGDGILAGLPSAELAVLSKAIQNIMSGYLLDAWTTSKGSLRLAERRAKALTINLVDRAKVAGIGTADSA